MFLEDNDESNGWDNLDITLNFRDAGWRDLTKMLGQLWFVYDDPSHCPSEFNLYLRGSISPPSHTPFNREGILLKYLNVKG